MSLVQRLSQASFLAAAVLAFVAGGATSESRALFGLHGSAVGYLLALVLAAGAGLAVWAVERGRRLPLIVACVLLLVGALDTSSLTLNGWALGYAIALVAGVELGFGSLRAARVPDAPTRAVLLQRYLRDLLVPFALVAVAVVLGAGLFLVAEGLLPAAFAASLERLSPVGVLAGALVAACLVAAYGLGTRALRRRSARRVAVIRAEAEAEAAQAEAAAPKEAA